MKRRNPSATTRIRENRGRGIYDRAVAFLLTVLALLIPLKFGVPNLDVSTPTVPDDLLRIGGHLANLFRALFSLDLRGALKTVAGVLTTPWPEEIAEILILLAFFLWGMKCLSERSLVLRVGKVDAAMWLFVLAGVVATLLSPGFHSSMVILKQFVSYALLYFLVVHALETPAQQRRILKCFLISTAIVALLALHQFFLGLEDVAQTIRRYIPPELQPDYLARVKYRRVFSAFMYPNSLAGFLLVSFPLTLLYGALHREWFRRKNVRKLIAYVLVLPLACFVSLLLTQSKAGLLTFLVVAVACVIAGRKRLRLKPRVLLVSLLVVLIVVLGVLFSPVGRRLLVEKGRFTLGERLDYWRAGYKMFLRSPVIGNGFNSFGLLYSGYCLPGANESRSAHNNFLQVLVETGIVGFLFFIGIWVCGLAAARSAIGRSLRGETPDRFSETVVLSAFIGISCFLIHSLADFDLYIPGIAMTVWLLLGLMVRNAGGAEGRPIHLGKRQAGALVFALVGVCGFGLFSAARTLNANSHLAVAQFIAESTNPPSGGAEYEEAIAEVRKAIRWDGSNHNLHLYLARLYFRMERYDEALEEYAAADRLLHGLSPMIAHRIGRTVLAEMEAGGRVEWEEVLEDFRKAVARSPSSPFHRLVYSYYLSRSGREEESRRELQEMRRLDPSGEKAFNSAVVIYRDDPFVDDLARFFAGRRETSSPDEARAAAEGER